MSWVRVLSIRQGPDLEGYPESSRRRVVRRTRLTIKREE